MMKLKLYLVFVVAQFLCVDNGCCQDFSGIWEAKKVVIPKSSLEPGPSKFYYRIEIRKQDDRVYVGRSYSKVKMRFWNSLGEPIIIFPTETEADFILTVGDYDTISFRELNRMQDGPDFVPTRQGNLKYVEEKSGVLLVGAFGNPTDWTGRLVKLTLRKISD